MHCKTVITGLLLGWAAWKRVALASYLHGHQMFQYHIFTNHFHQEKGQVRAKIIEVVPSYAAKDAQHVFIRAAVCANVECPLEFNFILKQQHSMTIYFNTAVSSRFSYFTISLLIKFNLLRPSGGQTFILKIIKLSSNYYILPETKVQTERKVRLKH